MAMANKIKHLLIDKNMDMKELAEKIGISSSNFYNKMKRDNFTEKDLRIIAEALRCDYEAYFVDKETGEKT